MAGGVPYPYLLDFFQSPAGGTTTPAALYRLLEYVGVPSQFVQTETFINPTNAAAAGKPLVLSALQPHLPLPRAGTGSTSTRFTPRTCSTA